MPAAAWTGIDKKAATTQLGVDGIDLNGPRYWLIDGIAGKGISATGKTITVNGITMAERATLDLSLKHTLDLSLKQVMGGKPLYTPTEVKRDTVFTFRPASRSSNSPTRTATSTGCNRIPRSLTRDNP